MTERVELRRYTRAPVNSPATFSLKGNPYKREGLCKDISVGGTFIETDSPGAFGSEVVIQVTLPGSNDPVSLPGTVRWVRDGGMGVQFGLLGARETHIITEIGRKYAGG